MFAAEHFESADMIAMFVSEQDAIELFRRNSAHLQARQNLARAQSTIDEQATMIGCDQGAVSAAAAAEHDEAEHCAIFSRVRQHSQIEMQPRRTKFRCAPFLLVILSASEGSH